MGIPCLGIALALLAAGGCAQKAATPSTSNPAEGKAPGTMSPAEQQVLLQQRVEAARSHSASGAANSGRPMTLETYKMMMNHMNAQQKIDFARKHPNITITPAAQ